MAGNLATYHAKRDFARTPEPHGDLAAPGEHARFVVQKHHARRLHYDFRLEIGGTLKSWAVPKGPSLDPADKRLAVHVEDHPLDYLDFEGDIPPRQYGAGHVEVWDIGTWTPLGDAQAGYEAGRLRFVLDGEKLHGIWKLVRTGMRGHGDKEQWFLIKERDEQARAAEEFDITEALPHSVLRGDGKAAPRAKKARTPAPALRKAPLPKKLAPQLATLVDAVPTGGDWLYEVKYDGYRMLARVEHGKARLLTRDGHDWSARLPQQVQAVESLGLDSAWLDGEIVVLDAQGVPSFQLLQNAFERGGTRQIVYFLFDVPYLNGHDLRDQPLRARRALLEQVLDGHESTTLRYSVPLQQPPQRLLDSACELALEGLIGKRTDSRYVSARSSDWIKLKCRRRQEMVIAGYTDPRGTRQFFGALLLGYYDDDGKLRYAGKVGSGFDGQTLADLHRRMQPLEQHACPFPNKPSGLRGVHWLRPKLVAEISFAEWTQDDSLRQAVFHGLRADKPASAVRRERPAALPVRADNGAAAARRARTAAAPVLEGVTITHAERVIDPASHASKLELAHYYRQIAPLILPWLANRPVYLLRVPEGIAGETFFQKHATHMRIPGVRALPVQLLSGRAPLIAIESAEALVGAAQMGTIELHTPNVLADRIDRPDSMVFDLDPDPDLPWSAMIEAARLTHVVLDELGLCSFLKTSGGKGLHLMVPLTRRHGWDEVKDFAQAVARHLARTLPQHFSATMGAKNRVGKIFIDYLRNGRSASTVAPYSVRARPRLPVSVPLAWDELDELKSAAQWTIADLPALLARAKRDPWAEYFENRQTITAAMKRMIGMK